MSDEASTSASSPSYYLLKAEPDSRIVKGKDVKFSVDDFEQIETSPWEGVRNFEARNIMKEMKKGDKALFYHSNCKNPGIAAFAEVSKEAYPDYTAWDPDHPYYDAKTEQAKPKWFMVDLTFNSRARYFVPLALLRYISTVSLPKSGDDEPDIIEELSYLGRKGVAAIKGMDLVTRGRLSVQRVKQEEWDAINQLAEQGGWEGIDLKKLGTSGTKSVKSASKGQSSKSVTRGKKTSRKGRNDAEADDTNVGETSDPAKAGPSRIVQDNEPRTIAPHLGLPFSETIEELREAVTQMVTEHLNRIRQLRSRELRHRFAQAMEEAPEYEGKGKGKEVVSSYPREGAGNTRETITGNLGAPMLDSTDARDDLSERFFGLLSEGPGDRTGMSRPFDPINSTVWRQAQSYPLGFELEPAGGEGEHQLFGRALNITRDALSFDYLEEDASEDGDEDEIMSETELPA